MPRVKNKLPSKPTDNQQESQPEKEFEPAESIVMLFLTGISDVGDIVGLMLLPIPVIGQILLFMAKVFSFFVWGIVQIWLVMKGVNRSSKLSVSKLATKPTNWVKFLFTGGSALDLAGLPFGQTISLAATIYMANHPKIVGLAEKVAVGAVTGGAGAAGAVAVERAAAQAGAKAMARRAGQSVGRVAMRAGKDMAQETMGDLMGSEGQASPRQEGEGGQVSDEDLGGRRSVFDELGDLTSEVQGEEGADFMSATNRARRQKRRERFTSIAGQNSENDDESLKEAA